MRALLVLLLATQIASADVADDTRNAHDAAIAGHCGAVVTLAINVKAADHNYYTSVFLADPAISACLTTPTTLSPPSLTPVSAPPVAAEMPSDETPPISGGRLAGELLVGGAFVIGGGLGGGFLGYSLETAGGCNSEFCGLGGAVIGAFLGGTLAAPLGVYLIGTYGNETGSLGAAYAGSLLGGLAGIAIVAAADEEDLILPVMITMPVVGSMIGFNLTRRYKNVRVTPVAQSGTGQTIFGLAGQF